MSLRDVILVTGANGLLGRALVSMLENTHEVWAIVHSMPSIPVPGVTYKVVDFSDEWGVSLLPEQVNAIVHLAQSAHFRDVPDKALEVFQVNISSTAKLLDYAWRVGAERFIYASSGGIYANGHQAFRENSPIVQPDTLGYYLGSKVSCEALASSYAKLMKIAILRFFFIYGYGQNRSMLIPRLVDNIRAGRPVLLQGQNGLRLNPIHVEDAAKSVVAALRCNSSAVYNIGGPQALSLRALCGEIEKLVGCKASFTSVPGEPFDVVGDISLMRSELHDPVIYPVDGLRDVT